MPKRNHEESKEERWSRKLKKYELKLLEKRRRNSQRVIYSSDEDNVAPTEHLDHEIFDYTDSYNDVAVSMPANEEEGLPITNEVQVTEEAPVIEATVSDDFDTEVLRALGDIEPETGEYSEDIHMDIASRFQQILVYGLKKEVREELIKKYLTPKNLPFSKAPILNPEIEAMLVETCRVRDKRLFNKQDQIGRALSGLGKAMTCLLKKNPDIPEVVRTLNDVGKLVADSHYAETDTRRSVIIPLVEKSLADPFKNRKRDNFLFGDSLGEVVKNSRGIKKTSQLIQAVALSTSSCLNYKGPSTRPRQQWVGQTYPQHRAGGQRANPQSRRRAAPYLPPPPQYVRRQTAPPPPPPPRRQPAQRQRAATERPQK